MLQRGRFHVNFKILLNVRYQVFRVHLMKVKFGILGADINFLRNLT